MNILFVLRSLDLGGIEVVTAVLANKFVREGHHVSVFVFEKRNGKVIERFCGDVDITIAGVYKNSIENIKRLRQLLINKKIDVVINQWGLPVIPIKTLCGAITGINVKIVSIYHNDPLQNGRIQSVEEEIQKTDNPLKMVMLRIKKFAYRCATGYAMRYNYQHSDVFEVLSPSFVSHFQQFTKLRNTPKLMVQTNPVTIDADGFTYNPKRKQKEIIYVGRVDYTQKRVCRVIEVWTLLEKQFPGWQLTIVGDGEERLSIEKMVKELGLKRVNFEGFQQPRPYYERASMLMLTSEFEGFGLVIIEAMCFGVVPVVYGSYSAVYDIIENGKNGLIIPKTSDGFNAEMMAAEMKKLMNDEDILYSMALNGIEKSKNYSIDKIYDQWMNLLQGLE